MIFGQINRYRFLRAGLLIVGVVFVMRLGYLQVVKHDEYVSRANELHVSKLTIQPERGEIFAKERGQIVPLVLNEQVYTLFADPQEVKQPSDIEAMIRRVVGAKVVDDSVPLLKNKKLRYVVLAKQISYAEAQEVKKANIPGVGLQAAVRRVYPEGQLAAQTLGYVNAEGKGQYGIESYYNDRLKGGVGMLEAVTDVRRIPLTVGTTGVRVPAKNGDNLVLTIDRGIQAKAEELLLDKVKSTQAESGGVLVMDPQTGSVLAMASAPTFNPAEYYKVKNYGAFNNGVISSPFEAGSVIKPLTVGMGLDSGAIGPTMTYNNTGSVRVDDRTIHNVEIAPKNPATSLSDILRYSLNTGVVYILQQMGGGQVNRQARNTTYDYFYNRFKLGQVSGIDIDGEQPGTLIAPDKVQGNNVRYANMVFGQGMDVTMMQVGTAFSALVNGGTVYQPRVVEGVRLPDGRVQSQAPKVVTANAVSPQVSAQMRDLLHEGRIHGTFKGLDRGFYVGGKTGTSQVIDPKTGQYTDRETIGSYLGFGATETPQYVIMVRIDKPHIGGYSGTTAAAPIFNELSNWLQEYLMLRPQE